MKEILLIKRVKTQNNGCNYSYDPTCFDHNIHIRLKKYIGDEVIAGFEQKLIFTIEYFLQKFIKSFPSCSVDFSIKDESEATKKYIFSKYVNEFKQTAAFKKIKNELYTLINFEDIIIKPVYSKKEIINKESQFGNILNILDEDLLKGDFDYHSDLLDVFTFVLGHNGSIKGFLLDDSTSLLLTEVEDNLNEKYINKNARKLAKEIKTKGNYEESKLW